MEMMIHTTFTSSTYAVYKLRDNRVDHRLWNTLVTCFKDAKYYRKEEEAVYS